MPAFQVLIDASAHFSETRMPFCFSARGTASAYGERATRGERAFVRLCRSSSLHGMLQVEANAPHLGCHHYNRADLCPLHAVPCNWLREAAQAMVLTFLKTFLMMRREFVAC